jgi:hypothetical protein
MKEKILAVILFAVTIIFVTVNTIIIDRQITDVIDDVEDLDLGTENSLKDAYSLYEDFMKKQGYISITVSHNDMTSIEDCFVEMIGYISVEDIESATVVKYRLKNSLEHLRRLSGFNIDAII